MDLGWRGMSCRRVCVTYRPAEKNYELNVYFLS
ncbi:hypothetical protein LINPERHAP1_LOCUS21075 [Linum perenne]